jgi:hypothetical protein
VFGVFLLFGLQLVKQSVQTLEALLPEPAVLLEPSVCVTERLSFDPAQMRAPHNAPAYKSGTLKDPNVLRGRWKRHPQGRSQLAQIPVATRQASQHRPPCGVRQRVKDTIQGWRTILNHVV